MHLITSKVYTRNVLQAIQQATERVYVLALIIQQESDSADIMTALTRAAHRGVDVRVMADFSTYSYTAGHLQPVSIYAKQSQVATDMVNRFATSNVKFTWLGMYHPFMFAGRTHSKWIIADDRVFSFGGINLHSSFKNDQDYMFTFISSEVADLLSSVHKQIEGSSLAETASLSNSVDTSIGTVLIDGGLPFDSIIYRHAKRIIEDSSSVLMVTQYCPTGKLARLIKHIDHKIYFNRPNTPDFLTNMLITTSEKITGITNQYAGSDYIHAKFLIATFKDGSKRAITGSHNFISYGGLLGTREIALETSDSRVISALENYYCKYIA